VVWDLAPGLIDRTREARLEKSGPAIEALRSHPPASHSSTPAMGLPLLLFLCSLLATPLMAAEHAGGLRVGSDPTLPPMIFKEQKKLVGIEADLAQGLARD